MTGYLVDALEMVPLPVALWECGTLRYVGGNTEAVGNRALRFYARCSQDLANVLESYDWYAPETGGVVLKTLGVADEAQGLCQHNAGPKVRATMLGLLVLSVMESAPDMPRPSLLVGTLHDPGKPESNAVLAHQRTVALLRTNEAGEKTIRVLRDAVIQLQSVVETNLTMLRETNHAAADMLRSIEDDDTPETAGA